jgi:hypothetical protein
MTDIKPTGKAIKAWFDGLEVGTELYRGRNTYCDSKPAKPYEIGRKYIVSRPGRWSVKLSDTNGNTFWLSPPIRVGDVVALDDDSITYKIEHRGEHTATWSKVPLHRYTVSRWELSPPGSEDRWISYDVDVIAPNADAAITATDLPQEFRDTDNVSVAYVGGLD